MSDKILIRGLEIQAKHGVNGYEKEEPQPFIIDADIYTDFRAAAVCDDLNKTVNYSAVCTLLEATVKNNCFNLIETLAYTCAYAVLDNFNAQRITLKIFKPEAPVKQRVNVGVEVDVQKNTAYLSLGSSLGDKKGYLDAAIEKLDKTFGIKVDKISSYIQTQPYGGVAKNTFLNCAVKVHTYLTPHALLEEIHRIENELDRVREKHWDDRTLDIDIIFFGDLIMHDKTLTIPHPFYADRDFVLKPLKEIAEGFICPDTGKPL